MEVGDPRQMGSPTLGGGIPALSYKLSFILSCFHVRSGAPHLSVLHSQLGQVTCLGGPFFSCECVRWGGGPSRVSVHFFDSGAKT